MTRRRYLLTGFLVGAEMVFWGAAEAFAATLPQGSIAVLVKGPSAQHVSTATSLITRQLIQKGYKAVMKHVEAMKTVTGE